MISIFWFRNDLRLADNPALLAAGNEVVPIVLESATESLPPVRLESLEASWAALNESLGGFLRVVSDLVETAQSFGAQKVFASRLYSPAGMAEQKAMGEKLAAKGIDLILGDGNYAVAPGKVRKPDGTAYRVYTPFYRAWLQLGWERPFTAPAAVTWVAAEGRLPVANDVRAGEAFALQTLERFLASRVTGYKDDRNRADLGGTSHLSHALAHGEIHPRTILARLSDSEGEITFAKELAWREFYADVLWHNPHTVTEYYEPRFAKMRYDFDQAKFDAWCQGKTGYPMVDAGMRQLLATGWMHNRVRMIVASFLVKDLHIEWQHGAAWFERHLTDFDVASNVHGWQWTAGCGTDASPYYRIFNPITQGYKFDPEGSYVRKFVPELRHISGQEIHEPWLLIDGNVTGYPMPIVDHSVEREESLARLEEIKLPSK